MKKEILALLLVSLVVFVSGCTLPWEGGGDEVSTPGAGTAGVVIKSFGPDVAYISSGQEIVLTVKAQNIGSEEAKITKATPILLSWKGFSSKEPKEVLSPPNPEIDKEGDLYIDSWDKIEAPEVSKVQDFKAGVILSYEYTTKSTSNAYAMKSSELARRKESGESIPKTDPTVNSDSPIHLEFRMQEDPLVIPEEGPKTKVGTITVSRAGGGNVVWDNTAKKYKIKITFPNKTPLGEDGGVTITDVSCSSVTLRRGIEGECTFKITLDGDDLDTPMIEIPLEAVADYTFEISTETTLTVHPAIE